MIGLDESRCNSTESTRGPANRRWNIINTTAWVLIADRTKHTAIDQLGIRLGIIK